MPDNGDVSFAELDEEKLKKYGLEISSSSWTSHSQDVVQINDRGSLKISKKMFNNFPDDAFVDNEVTIN